MSRIRWFAAAMAMAALAATAGCAAKLPDDPTPAPQLVIYDRAWAYQSMPGQEILTPHYRIFTTHTDPVYIQRVPQFLENALVHYQRMVKPVCKPDKPMEIYIFGQRNQWEHFTTEMTGPAASIYLKIQEGGYVDNGRAVLYDIKRMNTFAVTGHEAWHQYLWHYVKHRPPPWLDEGIACYFEKFDCEGSTIDFEPRQNLTRLSMLRFGLGNHTWVELPELLSTHPGNIIGGSAGKVATYYAELWALILFLQDDPASKAKFATLLADVGTQRMMEQAVHAGFTGQQSDFGPAIFRAYITTDLAAFSTRFQAYCTKLAF